MHLSAVLNLQSCSGGIPLTLYLSALLLSASYILLILLEAPRIVRVKLICLHAKYSSPERTNDILLHDEFTFREAEASHVLSHFIFDRCTIIPDCSFRRASQCRRQNLGVLPNGLCGRLCGVVRPGRTTFYLAKPPDPIFRFWGSWTVRRILSHNSTHKTCLIVVLRAHLKSHTNAGGRSTLCGSYSTVTHLFWGGIIETISYFLNRVNKSLRMSRQRQTAGAAILIVGKRLVDKSESVHQGKLIPNK